MEIVSGPLSFGNNSSCADSNSDMEANTSAEILGNISQTSLSPSSNSNHIWGLTKVYEHAPTMFSDKLATPTGNLSFPFGDTSSSFVTQTEKFVLLEIESGPPPINCKDGFPHKLEEFMTSEVSPPLPVVSSRRLPKYPKDRARRVDISCSTCICPNCGDALGSFMLNSEERKVAKRELIKLIGSFSSQPTTQIKNLMQFDEWLSSREEFVHIVDAANVAYNRQNFENGRFSYRQIEIIVKRLNETYPGEKILVIIPYAYAQHVVPNSVKIYQPEKRVMSYITEEDWEILERFRRDNILYIVPQGANDDWYWMLTTLQERQKPSYVITNDLMRDHRAAFSDSRTFIRWRTTQIIHFDFSFACERDFDSPEIFLHEPGKTSITYFLFYVRSFYVHVHVHLQKKSLSHLY